jgi:hypothetical protein
MSREDDVQWFRTFVVGSRWRFAKTYVESYPHEYTLDEWVDEDSFWRAILCIEQWGVLEPFWSAQRKYFYIDERMYWHMGDASAADVEEQPGLINRSWVDVARYRNDAKKLGYDDDALDGLVVRWSALLEKARRPSRLRPRE